MGQLDEDSVSLAISAFVVSFIITFAVFLCTGCTCNIAY